MIQPRDYHAVSVVQVQDYPCGASDDSDVSSEVQGRTTVGGSYKLSEVVINKCQVIDYFHESS